MFLALKKFTASGSDGLLSETRIAHEKAPFEVYGFRPPRALRRVAFFAACLSIGPVMGHTAAVAFIAAPEAWGDLH